MSKEQKDLTGAESSNSAVRSNPLIMPFSIVVAGILVALAIIFSGGGSVAPTEKTAGTDTKQVASSDEERLLLAEIQNDDHVRGNKNADVYILEFSDTECPFCKRFHETMQQVMEEYGDQVAWVYRHFPLAQLHSKAPRESEAMECANELGGSDAFWEYTDRIYEITPSNNGLEDSKLPEIAKEIGLDVTAFSECLDSGRYTDKVQKDFDNAVALGGRGTPHSLIIAGDQIIPINGAQPFDVIKSSLDSVLNN